MSLLKTSPAVLLLGLIAPLSSVAAPVCVATAGGFGNGGTTFVGKTFTVPGSGGCAAWNGFTKTANTVVLTTTGGGCLSSDGKALTLNLNSADPAFLGGGKLGVDYIVLKRSSSSGSFTSGSDNGTFGGGAKIVTCTSSLLSLPSSHD